MKLGPSIDINFMGQDELKKGVPGGVIDPVAARASHAVKRRVSGRRVLTGERLDFESLCTGGVGSMATASRACTVVVSSVVFVQILKFEGLVQYV